MQEEARNACAVICLDHTGYSEAGILCGPGIYGRTLVIMESVCMSVNRTPSIDKLASEVKRATLAFE